MADNFLLPVPGTSGDVAAADDIGGGVKVQRVKLTFGGDGVMTDASAIDPIPVVATITSAAISSVTPGVTATNSHKAGDSAATLSDTNQGVLGVRRDSDTTLGDNGDYIPPSVDQYGRFKTLAELSNGVPGIQDNTASNFTLGTTQGVAFMGYVDDTSPAAATEGRASYLRISSDHKALVQPYESSVNSWSYAAAAAGLVSTAGVTAKAAAGAGLRNYVTSVQVINSHASTATDVQIRDGASGTVLHRGYAAAGGGGFSAQFPVPLKGTANTLIEIAEGSATAANGVFVNLQGFVGV